MSDKGWRRVINDTSFWLGQLTGIVISEMGKIKEVVIMVMVSKLSRVMAWSYGSEKNQQVAIVEMVSGEYIAYGLLLRKSLQILIFQKLVKKNSCKLDTESIQERRIKVQKEACSINHKKEHFQKKKKVNNKNIITVAIMS